MFSLGIYQCSLATGKTLLHMEKPQGKSEVKGGPWMNTISPAVTYPLRCNTDVTSLLSGTAIKVVIAYISDYITKPTLKT